MDLEPGKQNAKRKRVPVKNERGTKVEDGDTDKRNKTTEDTGEPLPKRILRSASKKLPLVPLPAVIEIETPNGKSASTSRKPNALVSASKDNVKKKSKSAETSKPSSSKSKEFSEPENTERAKKPSIVLSNPTTKTVTGSNENVCSKGNTTVETEFTFQEELPKIEDHCSSLDTTTDDSIQGMKNPMLLGPIIRCIFGFMDIEDVKKSRFVSRDWSFAGKQALTSRALIRFKKRKNSTPGRLPNQFYSCFRNSAALFSSFGFSEDSWTITQLSKFFTKQEKSIKELKLEYMKIKDGTIVKNFDISPWISKSLMVKSEVKYLTKLSIYSVDCAIPLNLLQHIKDLSLAECRINLEAGVQIHPVKLSLFAIKFYQEDVPLPTIQINDIVNFSFAKAINLNGYDLKNGRTEIAIDLSRYCRLEILTLLQYVKTVNWETSKWDIRHMRLRRLGNMEFRATQMTINELYLSPAEDGDFDLFAFPQSIEKLGIGQPGEREAVNITCSEPTTLENLKYFSVAVNTKADYSFLAHFVNYPKLTHLEFVLECGRDFPEIKLTCIPKAVKTLTLRRCAIDWLFGSYCYANIEKIVVFDAEINFERISKAKISVHDIIFICNDFKPEVPKSVVNFFSHQNPWSLCKRFYIGKLKWDKMKLEDSVLNEHVDTKSAFYVFENGEKGRALDEISFYQLTDIPKHTNAYL